jgi:hypothetical protein
MAERLAVDPDVILRVEKESEINLTLSEGLDGLRRSRRKSNPTGKVLEDVTNRLHRLVGRREKGRYGLRDESDENAALRA